MSNLSSPKVISVIEQIKQLLEYIKVSNDFYTDLGDQIYFMKQWFDVRESHLPCISYFVLDEAHIEQKGCSFKHELNLKIELFNEDYQSLDIFYLISDVKKALLKSDLISIIYLGYEINLPEEGSAVVSATLNFKIHYIENIH